MNQTAAIACRHGSDAWECPQHRWLAPSSFRAFDAAGLPCRCDRCGAPDRLYLDWRRSGLNVCQTCRRELLDEANSWGDSARLEERILPRLLRQVRGES